MINVMLDPLPDTWNGHRIEPDFRVGLQIMQLLNDEDYSEFERLAGSMELLFLDMPENMEEAMNGITWFLNGWNQDHVEKGDNIRCVDFDIDQWRIYSAFLNQYRIDLAEADMHWWRFMGLLYNLKECTYTQVTGIRAEKIDGKMTAKEKEARRKAKRIYAIRKTEEQERITPEEQARYDDFMKFAAIKEASKEPV